MITWFALFFIAERLFHLPRPTVRTLIFLRLLFADQFAIDRTRNQSWFRKRPWPSSKLVVAGESTKVVGTRAAVCGWLMPAIGWKYAALVWGCSMLWFVLNDIVRMAVCRREQEVPHWDAQSCQRLFTPTH